MWNRKPIHLRYVFVLLVIVVSNRIVLSTEGINEPVSVIHCPNQKASLTARWQWAMEQMSKQPATKPVWIGYSTERLMSERSFIGRWPVDPDYPTLSELIYGVRVEIPERSHSGYRSAHKVIKEVVDVFEVDRASKSIGRIHTSNISLTVYMKRGVLLWLGKVGHEQAFSLLRKLFNETDNEHLKTRLIGRIGDFDHPEVISFLDKVLQNEKSVRVRKEAVDELDHFHNQESLDILLRTVQNDSSETVRKEAIDSISHLECPAADNALIEIAKDGPSPGVRREAIDELEDRPSPDVMECLLSIINEDKILDVQREALEALAQIENDTALDMFIRIVNTHPNLRIRCDAIDEIDELKDRAPIRVITCLESIINKQDEIYKIRTEALDALTDIENDKVLDVLIRIAGSQIDPRLREEVIDELDDIDKFGLNASTKTIECLESIINNRDEIEKIQRTALDQLTEFEMKESLNALIRIAQTHMNPRIRLEAIDQLSDQDVPEVMDCLNRIVNKQDELYKIQQEALERLTDIEEDRAVDMLIQVVKTHTDPRIRRKGIDALNDVDELRLTAFPKAVDCLVFVINNKNELEQNRLEALEGLADIENTRAMDALIRIAGNHTHPRVREEAIDYLCDMDELYLSHTPKVIKCFQSIIDNPAEQEETQRRALDALQEIEHQDVRTYITKIARSHPKQKVRKEAQEIVAEWIHDS